MFIGRIAIGMRVRYAQAMAETFTGVVILKGVHHVKVRRDDNGREIDVHPSRLVFIRAPKPKPKAPKRRSLSKKDLAAAWKYAFGYWDKGDPGQCPSFNAFIDKLRL